MTFKQKWVAALRSGEYKQGIKYLNGDGGFCCLGVACDLFVKAGLGKWADSGLSAPFKTFTSENGVRSSAVMPNCEAEKLGISSVGAVSIPPEFGGIDPVGADATSLVVLNDRGVPFSQIAEVIETCIPDNGFTLPGDE